MRGLAALRLQESLKKCDICSWGTWGPGLGLLPVGFGEETSPGRLVPVVTDCMLAFGVRENRESLQDINAVTCNLYQQPLLFISHGDSLDVHTCHWCSSDFGWVKKSRKDLNLSSCGHWVSGFSSAFRLNHKQNAFGDSDQNSCSSHLFHLSKVWGLRAAPEPVSRSTFDCPTNLAASSRRLMALRVVSHQRLSGEGKVGDYTDTAGDLSLGPNNLVTGTSV